MKTYAKRDDFICYRFEPGDGDLHWLVMNRILADKVRTRDTTYPNREGVLNASLETGPDYWSDVFCAEGTAQFVLMPEANDADDLSVAGYGSVSVEESHPTLSNGHIMFPFRRRGHSNLLYEARLAYLRDETGYERCFANIHAGNRPSIRAAKSNGFYKAGEYQDSSGKKVFIYERLIERPVPKPTLEIN